MQMKLWSNLCQAVAFISFISILNTSFYTGAILQTKTSEMTQVASEYEEKQAEINEVILRVNYSLDFHKHSSEELTYHDPHF